MPLTPEAITAIYKHGCPVCSQPIGPFRDDISQREFYISGMCQECQDEFFDCPEDCDDCA